MTPTKEQQAQEYAENMGGTPYYIQAMYTAFLDGYTACEQSMWRSVEDVLPALGENQCVVIRTKRDGKFKVAYFDRQCRVFDVKVGSYSCEIYRLCEITHIFI